MTIAAAVALRAVNVEAETVAWVRRAAQQQTPDEWKR
jgi:hypothetical protein